MDNLTVTQSEAEFCAYQMGQSGSFMKLLISAMMHADVHNTHKLSLGYPDLSIVVSRFQNESGYWQALEKRWNGGSSVTIIPD